jgi:hypothetical protein
VSFDVDLDQIGITESHDRQDPIERKPRHEAPCAFRVNDLSSR